MKAWRIIFALALVGATWLLRAPGLEKKIWNVDEAVTFTMAEQILHDEVPYRDAVDQRTPLAPYAQAAVFAVAGHWNIHAQHAVLALMIGVTAVMLWQTARRAGDEAVGVAGALWFTWLALLFVSVRDTMPAHTAWYLIFFSTLGFWAFVPALTAGSGRWAAAAGVAFALSFLAKQPGVLDLGVALVLLGLAARAEAGGWRKAGRLGATMLAAFALTVGAVAGYFAAKGAWADFIYYTWTYNQTLYVPEVSPLARWATIRVPFALAWASHPLLLIGGVAAGIALLVRAARQGFNPGAGFNLLEWLILGWCAAGLYATTLSGRGFTHYSIQLIPGLALACGWLTARAWSAARQASAVSPAYRTGLIAAGAAGVAWLLWPVAARIRAFDLPEPGAEAIGRLVRTHTQPADRIFVWGYTPEVYVVSERLPATRFLYNTFVTGLIPWTNLDPLRNTDYAVVPGARAQFLADWHAHSPALVVDGRTQRGFMKYPLEKQGWLWPLIEAGYAEVASAHTTPLGFWFFQRLETAGPAPLPAELPVTDDVHLRFLTITAGETARVFVDAGADVRALELYLDDVRYRRLAVPAGGEAKATFFVPPSDWPGTRHRLRAVAVGANGERRASRELALVAEKPSDVMGGPALDFGGQPVAALATRTITGGPVLLKKEEPTHWDAHAPSEMVYPWLPGMTTLAFAYGIEKAALDREPPNHTDGVEIVVKVQDAAGQETQLFREYFDRDTARRAGGEAVGYAALPAGGSGRIILQMTPGPENAPAFDWSYWRWLRADRSPLPLLAGRRARHPLQLSSPAVRQTLFNGQFITVTMTPATIEYAAAADLDQFAAGFGLLDRYWLNQGNVAPVEFRVGLIGADGSEKLLFGRTLDPARNPADRGAQSCKVQWPPSAPGRLRLSARATDGGPADAFWADLRATVVRTALQFGEETIAATRASEAKFGFVNTEEDGRPCLFAHAPTRLVYPWQEGMARITGEYGLLSGAYTTHQTEGVVFLVEVQAADGSKRDLFRRHLAPSREPADRGAQKLSVELPPTPGGIIILSTLPPPSGSLDSAWSYWRDLSVGPAPGK